MMRLKIRSHRTCSSVRRVISTPLLFLVHADSITGSRGGKRALWQPSDWAGTGKTVELAGLTSERSQTVTDTINDVAAKKKQEPVVSVLDEQGVAEQLVAQARAKGIDLVGPDGLLNQLTKRVFEAALEEEMSEHLGYDKHDPAGRNHGNSRNGVRAKTVLTEIGPVEIDVPRDTDASFEPQIVKKRQRRLMGFDEIVRAPRGAVVSDGGERP